MNKRIARKPVVEMKVYMKYGLVRTRYQTCICPRCRHILNAGPNYQPRYCDQCGQRLSFKSIEWEEDKEIGIEGAGI